MRPIKIRDNLLGRRARIRRNRVRVGVLIAVLAMIAGTVWLVSFLRQANNVSAPTMESLLMIEPPRIVIPAGLDEYLSPEADGGADADQESGIPQEVHGEVQRGEPLFTALQRKGVPTHSIQPVINSVGELYDFRRSRVGDMYDATLDDEGTILSFRYQATPEVAYEARLVAPGEYQATRVEVPLDIEQHTVALTLQGSLYNTIKNLGEKEELARKITEILQWDIDFSKDVRPGDSIRMIYERVNLNGHFLRYGRILAFEYHGMTANIRAYWFEAQEQSAFFSESGQPIKRMFLRAPVVYRRISSPFDLTRLHPVLKRVRPHLGVDYAADTGTPVRAVADGVVLFSGFRGASGQLVSLKHEHQFETGYAHMNSIARGITRGAHVRQGQIVGYVGSTGRSTGAHLHFSMKYQGHFIDPEDRAGSRLPPLEGRELQEFQRVRDRYQLELEELPAATYEPASKENKTKTKSAPTLGKSP